MNQDFELVSLRGGGWGIRSVRYGEICHPGVGPRVEAEAVYVGALQLRRRWREEPGEFVVWDVGLGGAANATAVMHAAAEVGARLRVVSFDWDLEPLRYAVRNAAVLGYFGGLEGSCREFGEGGSASFEWGRAWIRWEFVGGDFTERVREWGSGVVGGGAPHAILYDPHSPAANPEMWTLPHFSRLRACLDPGRACGLATYSRSTSVRVALLLAGFWVGVGRGTATKEETTVAADRREGWLELLNGRWLERVRRSQAAEPWVASPFGGRPLSEASWELLRAHPQFREKPGASHPGAP